MPVKLYGIDLSFPVRAVFLTAKAINLKYDYQTVSLLNGEHMTPEYLKMNPQHTVPTLDDNGFYLWDSHAICTYLISKYAPDSSLYPTDAQQRAIVDRLLHFDSGILFVRARNIFFPIFRFGVKEIASEKIDAVIEAYDFLEKFLEGNKWTAGKQMTVADLCIAPVITSLAPFINIDADKYPNITRWLQQCAALPYFNECNQPGLEKLVNFIKDRLA